MHTLVHTHMQTLVHTHMQTLVHTHVRTHSQMATHATCVHTCTYTHVGTLTDTYATCVHTCTYMHINTYKHTNTHAHTYIHTQQRSVRTECMHQHCTDDALTIIGGIRILGELNVKFQGFVSLSL